MYTYKIFFETLKRKGISQNKLINDYEISRGQLDRMRKNESITIATIEKLCSILECEITEIVTIHKAP